MRFPLDLSLFDKYILCQNPIECGDYRIQVEKNDTPSLAIFSIQATLKKEKPPIDGSMPQLEISFSQHEKGHKHQEPHIQVRIHRPCAGDKVHIGTYYLTLDIRTVEEAEHIVRGYICVARDMLYRIDQGLPTQVFNVDLVKEDRLDDHVALLQQKINSIHTIYLKPSSPLRLRLPGGARIKTDNEGYAALTRTQFKDVLEQSDESRLMQPLLQLVK